jgi:DNA-binding MarR family transcriptional regulator
MNMRTHSVQKIDKPTVFISFNCKWSNFVDSLEYKIAEKATVIRYENDIAPWSSFTDFMNGISEHDFAVLVILDAYLKSSACMYEVLQLIKATKWQEKTMFALMPDSSSLYQESGRLEYIKYWIDKCSNLEKQIADMPATTVKKQREELEYYYEIRDSIGDFLSIVADSHNPQIYVVLDEICKKIDISTRSHFVITDVNGENIGLRQWLILQMIKGNDGITMRYITDHLGMSVATVSRTLNRFLSEGKIIESGKELNRNRWVRVFKTV